MAAFSSAVVMAVRFAWWYCSTEGAVPSGSHLIVDQLMKQVGHLNGVDGGVIPTDAVACLTDEPTNHAVRHASHELDQGFSPSANSTHALAVL